MDTGVAVVEPGVTLAMLAATGLLTSFVSGGQASVIFRAILEIHIQAVVIVLLASSNILVWAATEIAHALNVDDVIIGLTIVAVGTSLPELVTSVVAARKGKADVALGNVLGSNVFNILGILGVSAIVFPFSLIDTGAAGVPLEVAAMQFGQAASMVTWTDMGAIFLSVILLFVFAFTGRKVARWEGGILLAAYFLYIGMRFDLIPTFAG